MPQHDPAQVAGHRPQELLPHMALEFRALSLGRLHVLDDREGGGNGADRPGPLEMQLADQLGQVLARVLQAGGQVVAMRVRKLDEPHAQNGGDVAPRELQHLQAAVAEVDRHQAGVSLEDVERHCCTASGPVALSATGILQPDC